MFSLGADSRLYNEGPRRAEIELRESLETVVEDDREQMAVSSVGS
jgi:hypothetical protein